MASIIICRVHPTVVFNIIDFYERRPETAKDGVQNKVIGTLLGNYEKGVVEVTNCYSVPHAEVNNEEAQLQTTFNKEMFELHRKSSPTEVPVGWFSSNPEVNNLCLTFHDYYQEFVRTATGTREQLPVILLTVDTSLRSGRMGMKAYARTKAGIPKSSDPHCTIFVPLELEISTFQPEQVGLDVILAGKDNPKRVVELQSGIANLRAQTADSLRSIRKLKEYVDDVLKERRPADNAVGRRLMELVSSVTQVQPKQFESLLNASLKDYLMVVYLAQLAKTQLSLNEKLIKL